MPERVPTLAISSPSQNAVVGAAPFAVSGLVTAPGMPEPVTIMSVTIQVDSQPAVKATLKHIVNRELVEVTFSATVQITGGQDPHTITVSVASDAGVSVTKTVTVTAGLRFAPPAFLMDIATIGNVSIDFQSVLSTVAQQIAMLPLLAQIQSGNKIVVGPNVLQIASPRPMLRVGVWILDAGFAAEELVQPTKDFPLPQLTPDAAAGCFGLAPLLDPPPPATIAPATEPMFGFAFSVPTTTLQFILEVMLPEITKEAASNDFTLNSATIQTDTSGSVTTTFSGTLPASVPLTATVVEKLGIVQRSVSDQFMPAVVSSSNSTSVGDAAQWIVGVFLPFIDLYMLSTWGIASYGAGETSGQATGIIRGFLDALPSIVPFRNSSLPASFQSEFPFPMAVLNFHAFSTDGSGIVGSGTVSLGTRNQSLVAVNISGPDSYPNYSSGVEGFYNVLLSGFEPDQDQMTWQVSGVAKKNSVSIDPFFQQGGFSTDFPLPAKAQPGEYHFTVSVNAAETCATDATQKLTGSATLAVTAKVAKALQPE